MTPALDPDRVLAELARLWAALEEEHSVVRACALTLAVVAEESDDPAAIALTLAELMREHPHRAIVVRLSPDPSAPIEHHVISQCWRPAGQRDQICCEQIEIYTPAAALTALAPTLAALRAPDLPAALWVRTGDFSALTALGAEKIIVDLGAVPDASAALAHLAAAKTPALGDLAWTRLTRWRETVARIFEDPAALAQLPSIAELRVFYSGDRIPPEAFYAAGWVHAALGREAPVRFERDGVFGIEFLGGAFPLSARSDFATRTEASLLAEELAITGRDPVYDSALQFAARLAGRERR